ncbi:MAG: Hpt domain-containing protein [Bacteriovorax sp.]|jgi:HPt (histidine-containing phosphotransfer) domain-containing protein
MKAKTNSNRVHEIEKYFCSQGKVYLDKRVEDLKEIQHSLEDIKDTSNLEKIKKIGHRIKGSAGLYGFSKLSEIGFRIETTVQSGDLTTLSNVVSEFQSFLNEAKTDKKKS